MKRPLETISARNSYEQWLPALETASREVFRMVLGAELVGVCFEQSDLACREFVLFSPGLRGSACARQRGPAGDA